MKKMIPLLALAIPLTACEEVEQACTDDARVSVTVEVVDEAGETVPDAAVRYDAGDGEVDCVVWEDTYSCGTEIDGELDILVSAAGYEDQVIPLTIESDECHVIGQELLVELVEVEP